MSPMRHVVMGLATLVLAACAGSPPAQLLHLPTAWPAEPVARTALPLTSIVSLQLLLPVRLPDYLDHDALLVQQGTSGLQRVNGWRWAEPLAQAVPRVLRTDLAALVGEDRLWTHPLPAGARPTRLWRVEISAFEADESRRVVRLRARWTLADATGSTAPRAFATQIEAPAVSAEAPALAAAHRAALAQLALRMVEGLP